MRASSFIYLQLCGGSERLRDHIPSSEGKQICAQLHLLPKLPPTPRQTTECVFLGSKIERKNLISFDFFSHFHLVLP